MYKFIIIVVLAMLLGGCFNDNANVAKIVGGNGVITLPPKTKLVLMTWKGHDAWLLTRPFRDGEKAEEYTYQEVSTFGIMEATIKIKEQE